MSQLPERVWIAGCGYLGQALAALLSDRGVSVLGITHSEQSAHELASNVPYPVAACDLSEAASVAGLCRSQPAPTAVVHCASSGRGGADRYRAVYLGGCHHLLGELPETHLLFTSSTSVYGQTGGETVGDTSPAEPDRETGQILRQTEELVLASSGTIARLAGLYGPGRSVLLQRFLAGSACIETGVSRFLNQIHRDDAAAALALLLENPHASRGLIFNVSDGSALTQRACYEALAAHFDQAAPPEAPPDLNRKRGWTHKRVVPERLLELGWRPRYASFLDAVREDPRLVESLRAKARPSGERDRDGA